MSNWKFIRPEATTNYALNPTWGINDGFTAEAGTTVGRSATYQLYGPYSLNVNCNADDEGVEIDLGTLANAAHYVTVRMRSTSFTADWDWSLDDANWTTPTEIKALDANWSLYGASFVAGQANGSTTLHIHQNGAGVLQLYLDGIQVEQKSYWTTLTSGQLEGCEWNGAEYNSTSSRSAQSRAGGRLLDFGDDYSFYPTGWTGWGVAPTSLGIDSYALLPGGQLNSVKVHEREFAITGLFHGTSLSNLHSIRDALEEELVHDRYPKTAAGWQPVTIRYEGATVHKEIRAHYAGGLEGGLRSGFTETCAIRFNATDPYWYEIGNDAAVLDSNDTITERYMAARLRSTGQWDDLGLAADPEANGSILAICVAADGSVYFGGQFEDIEDSGDDADYVVRFDPSDESWNVLVGASDVNGIVRDIKEGPDGTIYLCGAFTAVNGVAANDYIVSYNPTADTWSPLGDPDSGAAAITDARAMAIDSVGDLYVVGNFENWADVAAADYIAKWDMSASSWGAVGAPNPDAGYPYCIALDSQDNIIVGGNFTDWLGDDSDYNYLARWNGSAWADLASGTQSGSVNSLVFSADDILYLGGAFTDQGGDADCDYVCAWNGRQFQPMIGGVTLAAVSDVAIAPDGTVCALGFGPIAELMFWNGSAWALADADINAQAIDFGPADPVIPTKYDIWIGDSASTADVQIAGTATVTNNGTAPQYPILKVYRSGGTSATLYTLGNETTGKRLMFNSYALLDGETLTVDCRPEKQSITSSFFGARPDAILANCDFGSFTLQPGSNQITCFVDVAGAPTVTAWLEWDTPYKGAD